MNKNIRNISKSSIIALFTLYASATPSHSTDNPTLTNQEEIASPHTHSSLVSEFFSSDEFQDLLDGPPTVVALRHIRASFTSMSAFVYEYLRTVNPSYLFLWNVNFDLDLALGPDHNP